MAAYRVIIPTAGLGSRLGSRSRDINKALVTVAHKPIISHIIEKFPENIEIVIALGYKKNDIRDYLELAYPTRCFLFVEIDNFEGEGSGLGHTLLCCKDLLQCPFIFCSNDTMVLENIPPPNENWMGYADINNSDQYRSVRLNEERTNIVEICGKGVEEEVSPYIGLAGIKDYETFWNAMSQGKKEGAVEIGESYGLRFLLPHSIRGNSFTWFDTGNEHALIKTRAHFHDNDSPNVLEKEGEAIWFVGDTVIKYSIDESFIKHRAMRTKHLDNFVPKIIAQRKNMYSYKKVQGYVFSKSPNSSNFQYFLDWIKGLWVESVLTPEEKRQFNQQCDNFYREKTLKRVALFFNKFEQIDANEIINGQQVPKLSTLLEQLDWSFICNGTPVRFHGDLHFENILVNEGSNMPFTLLDWRQDFAGNLEVGDIYYDLAKLYHGLIISHELVLQNHYHCDRELNVITYDFLRKQSLVECEQHFREFIVNNGYDLHKVHLLTALIFLNIAPLHHYPYCLVLFYLGKSMLYKLTLESQHGLPTEVEELINQ